MASKMTTKQQLRQQLKEERAGIDVTAAMQKTKGKTTVKLTVPRAKVTVNAAPTRESEMNSTDNESSDDDESDSGAMAVEVPAPAPDMKRPMPVPKRPTRPSAQDLMRRPHVKASEPARYVSVKRPPDIQQNRLALPILQEEHTIMEAIKDNSVVIICGETGSGKTTQVPQFL